MTLSSEDVDADALQKGNRWTIAIFALLGLGLGLAVFAFRGPVFDAQAVVDVSNPAGELADEIGVVTGSQVLSAATSALGYEPNISATASRTSSELTITVTNSDPDDAAEAANMVAAIYVQAQPGAAANIVDLAESPDTPVGLGPLIFAGVGLFLGAAVGAVFAAYRTRGRRQDFLNSLQRAPGSTRSTTPTEDVGHLGQSRPVVEPSLPVERSVPVEAHPQADSEPAPPAPALAHIAAAPEQAEPVLVLQELPQQPQMPPVSAQSAPADTDAPMDLASGSFSNAAGDESGSPALSWMPQPAPDDPSLEQLDRLAMQAQFDTARYELVLAQDEQIAKLAADHERETASLRAEVTSLNKQVRMQSVRLKNRSGTDQSRVGDLEIQVDALEVELAALRQTLETERIAHTKRITDERGAADRALDNARRQYREELSKHVHSHRQTLAEHRADLDEELAQDRAKQARALEQEHVAYEAQLESERARAESKLAGAQERHDRALAALQATNLQELDHQGTQHKKTIASLRSAGEKAQEQLRELEKETRKLRVELTSQQKQARHNETENAASLQRLRDEVALLKNELSGERQRNEALRADVLRRSAEAHQTIDRAVEERTAQLAELEASVSRQRQYADSRVREMSTAAEEQARQAATREASLTATVSRLKRELEDLKKIQSEK